MPTRHSISISLSRVYIYGYVRRRRIAHTNKRIFPFLSTEFGIFHLIFMVSSCGCCCCRSSAVEIVVIQLNRMDSSSTGSPPALLSQSAQTQQQQHMNVCARSREVYKPIRCKCEAYLWYGDGGAATTFHFSIVAHVHGYCIYGECVFAACRVHLCVVHGMLCSVYTM